MLTIIGFSVHDTIVVYDRIRENRSRHAGERFSNIVNHSILQTLARSINTSLTVVFTLTALFLFGGDSIRPFVLALLIGITSGTYSSIFNAAPLLTVWEEWEARRKERNAPGRPVRRPSA
jgi:preprotein translocase subunit SecF